MKKNIVSILFILISIVAFGQIPPQAFNYSSVIRGNNGQALPNKYVSLRLTILSGSATGAEAYQETHFATTSQIGVINLEIGNGAPVTGVFSEINWGANNYYLQIELDDDGGTNFEMMGTAQFLSVPYALYCGNVAGGSDTSNTNEIQTISISNDTIYLTDGGSIILPLDNDASSTNELQALSISNDTIFLSNGGFVKLPSEYSGTNTDEQQLSMSNDTISLSNGGNVKLPGHSGHYVGELFGGGIVFYVDQTGEHGLIASLDDLDDGNGVAWGLPNTDVPNCESMTDGAANTASIIAAGGGVAEAAGLCNSYVTEGFYDWYLPSYRELYLLASQDILINQILDNDGDESTNGFSQEFDAPIYGGYWSSTENNSLNMILFCSFCTNTASNGSKDAAYRVRAIRIF